MSTQVNSEEKHEEEDDSNSDTERRAMERSGDDAWNRVKEEMGVSITQRCRHRLAWARGDSPEMDKDNWVCERSDCERSVCKLFHEYLSSKQELQRNKQELQQNKQELQQNKQEVDDAINLSELLRQKVLKMSEDAVTKAKDVLVKECDLLLKEHVFMKEVLINGKASGNKTDHKTLCTNKAEMEKEAKEMDEAETAKNQKKPHPSPSTLCRAWNNNKAEEYSIPTSLDQRFAKQKDELEGFYNFCDALFSKCIKPRHAYMTEAYDADILKTVKTIVDWKPNSRRNTRQTAAEIPEVVCPSHVAQETRGVHPILLALMWKINSILKGTAHFTSEQFLPKDVEKSKRWMDAMWSKAAQHFLSAANGNLVGKSAEFKPLSREGVEYRKMVDDGINQDLGHNLQVLWDSCFQFCGGLGKDGKASSIVLTMISASLVGSSISGVGTTSVELDIEHTKNLPLFSKTAVQNLAGDMKIANLGLKFTQETMQPGFLALVDFISDEEEMGEEDAAGVVCSVVLPDSNNQAVGHFVNIEEYLGSGAFCSVYKCNLSIQNLGEDVAEGGRVGPQQPAVGIVVDAAEGDQEDLEVPGDNQNPDYQNSENQNHVDVVLKMSKDPLDKAALDAELKALKELKHDSIPKLFVDCLVKVTVKARCERNSVSGLLLQADIGKSLQDVVKSNCIKITVQEVLNGIYPALGYAHDLGWYHLDVQPSNILVVVEPDDTKRLILNDWGSAVKGDSNLKSLHGTVPFTHPEMLLVKKKQSDKWRGPKPKPVFDKFSLAMTLAYIVDKKVPWPGFHKKVVTNYMLTDRHDKACALIGGTDLDRDSKQMVLGWIGERPVQSFSSQVQTPKQDKARKRRQGTGSSRRGKKAKSVVSS